jgi:putative ABC transport system substrate-binding protein
MDRRRFLLTSLASALVAPLAAEAQQRLPKIGLLSIGTDPDPSRPNAWGPFLQQLRDLGYIEGQTVTFERRFAGGRQERLDELVADLSRLRIDVIVGTAELENVAAKRAMPTTPIVMMFVPDPIGAGLVTNLARPGGNVTGLTTLAPELYAKRLQLLKEALPTVGRVGLLFNPTYSSAVAAVRHTAAAAHVLTLQLRNVEVRSPTDVDGAFSTMSREKLQAVVVVTDGVLFNQRARVAEAAVSAHLPTMCEVKNFADAGCLIAYGPSYADLSRRAAIFVDKILKGAKPTDLPVEQPTKFELVINLKTAKALGLTIPPSLLLRADQVIE